MIGVWVLLRLISEILDDCQWKVFCRFIPGVAMVLGFGSDLWVGISWILVEVVVWKKSAERNRRDVENRFYRKEYQLEEDFFDRTREIMDK
jgi:hypothetical protein